MRRPRRPTPTARTSIHSRSTGPAPRASPGGQGLLETRDVSRTQASDSLVGGADSDTLIGYAGDVSECGMKLLSDTLVLCSKDAEIEGLTAVQLATASKCCLLLTEDICGLATATRGLFESAGLNLEAYPGRAMSYGALEDWVELGLGSAVMPRYHVRNRAIAHSLQDAVGVPLALEVEAVWKSPLASAEHAASFLTYLHRVAPTFAREMNY